MQLQIAAKPSVLCCHLVNTNEELGGLATAIPPYAELLWSLSTSQRLFIFLDSVPLILFPAVFPVQIMYSIVCMVTVVLFLYSCVFGPWSTQLCRRLDWPPTSTFCWHQPSGSAVGLVDNRRQPTGLSRTWNSDTFLFWGTVFDDSLGKSSCNGRHETNAAVS